MNWPAFIQSEVFWFRLLLLAGALGISGFGFIKSYSDNGSDPLQQRLLLSAIWLFVLLFSFVSTFIKNRLVDITCWLMFGVHVWSIFWVDANNYKLHALIGYVISFTALNLTYLRPRLYYPFMLSSLVASLVLLYTGPEPAVSREMVAFMFVLLGVAFLFTSSIVIVSKSRLSHLNENLEQLANERSAQAEERAHQLSLKNQELEQFAFIASHDLKTPLRSIGSFTQLAQRKLQNNADPEVLEYLAFIHDAVHKMNNLINDILAYSKFGRQNNELKKLKVRDLLEDCCLMHKPVIAAKNAEVEFQIHCEEVKGDKVQLQQLFHHLIDNALKYNHSPSAKLVITVEDRPLTWQFSFADNGIGISEEYHEKVFRIFQRLHNYKEYDGTGMGLALCKRIVENHGGDIWLESNNGQGTVVYFTLAKSLHTFLQRRTSETKIAN